MAGFMSNSCKREGLIFGTRSVKASFGIRDHMVSTRLRFSSSADPYVDINSIYSLEKKTPITPSCVVENTCSGSWPVLARNFQGSELIMSVVLTVFSTIFCEKDVSCLLMILFNSSRTLSFSICGHTGKLFVWNVSKRPRRNMLVSWLFSACMDALSTTPISSLQTFPFSSSTWAHRALSAKN